MFDHARYASRGAMVCLSIEIQGLLWYMLDSMKARNKDYLQIFTLSVSEGKQKIIHTQEKPFYQKEFIFPSINPLSEKIYVIDDGDHSTMILANEY